MSDPVILVGRRPDGAHRDRLWAYCADWWRRELGWPIIEGRDSGDGPFSLSAASNDAYRRACVEVPGWDVALYVGSDVILAASAQAVEAVECAVKCKMLYFAHEHYWYLSEEGTERVLAGERPDGPAMCEWPGKGPWTAYSSVASAVPRWLWEAVGGFDERFVGFGGEDHAAWAAWWARAGGYDRIPGEVYHLWHPRDHAVREGSPTHQENMDLRQRYQDVRTHWPSVEAILHEPGAPLGPKVES